MGTSAEGEGENYVTKRDNGLAARKTGNKADGASISEYHKNRDREATAVRLGESR